MFPKVAPNGTAAWHQLQQHYQTEVAKHLHMRQLFREDPDRFSKYSLKLDDILFDYSKNIITGKTLNLLRQLAEESKVKEAIEAMFTGEKINQTENRSVLHTALRNFSGKPVFSDGKDVMPEVREVRARMKAFSEAIHDGARVGASGKRLRHIVNIGIGGSHLGPMFAAAALKDHQRPDMTVDFVSNPDRTQIDDVLKGLDPAATLFVVASKTFTTVETMANAQVARAWIAQALGDSAVRHHFAAISTNLKAVAAFGIDADAVFPMWDWVGGRYSLWSAIGLSVVLACGYDAFARLLAGAEAMDRHFESAPLAENLPVISLFANPIWYEYSTRRFTGWVTEEDQKFRPQVHDGTRERVWHALALKPIEGAQF